MAIISGSQFNASRAQNITANQGGTRPQRKIEFTAFGQPIPARVKKTEMSEAIVYERLRKTQDPLHLYVPPYLGALDPRGAPIDVNRLLETRGRPALCREQRDVQIVLKDLSEGYDVAGPSYDFKFRKPALFLASSKARKAHALDPRGPLHYLFKSFIASPTKFPFLYSVPTPRHIIRAGSESEGCLKKLIHKIVDLWYLLKNYTSLWNSERQMRQIFEGLHPDELSKTIAQLKHFACCASKSRFVSADSSVLLTPTHIDEKRGLKIHLIDFAQGMEEDEGFEEFNQMKIDLVNSIHALVHLAESVRRARPIEEIEMHSF